MARGYQIEMRALLRVLPTFCEVAEEIMGVGLDVGFLAYRLERASEADSLTRLLQSGYTLNVDSSTNKI